MTNCPPAALKNLRAGGPRKSRETDVKISTSISQLFTASVPAAVTIAVARICPGRNVGLPSSGSLGAISSSSARCRCCSQKIDPEAAVRAQLSLLLRPAFVAFHEHVGIGHDVDTLRAGSPQRRGQLTNASEVVLAARPIPPEERLRQCETALHREVRWRDIRSGSGPSPSTRLRGSRTFDRRARLVGLDHHVRLAVDVEGAFRSYEVGIDHEVDQSRAGRLLPAALEVTGTRARLEALDFYPSPRGTIVARGLTSIVHLGLERRERLFGHGIGALAQHPAVVVLEISFQGEHDDVDATGRNAARNSRNTGPGPTGTRRSGCAIPAARQPFVNP